jgi:hypothetical protein
MQSDTNKRGGEVAVLIPALGACVSRMTSGEKRLAERLEQKLDDDYLLWYDVPVGPKQTHPDFVIIHPRRGLLILETKDWALDTIKKATKQYWEIAPDGQTKVLMNPLAQARHCAIQVVNALERDSQLVQPDGPHQGKLAFPWGHGVIFTRITRKQFDSAGLGEAIEPHYVICQDEMTEAVDAEAFQQRLWHMFPHAFGKVMSVPQLERARWIMFPEVRIPTQTGLFGSSDGTDDLPDIMRVMDLQQEQLARSLGEGHRVIHGVAGSGKTMILGYRAEFLAKASATKPVLVLCYNEPLAVSLESMFAAKVLTDRVHVRNFHKWCRQQLKAFGQTIPAQGPKMFDQMVDNVIRGVERNQIPSGQYQAVLIDEGHDFQPEWFKLVVQMVDPTTNSLLVLYDHAQSIYGKTKALKFSFRSVGIHPEDQLPQHKADPADGQSCGRRVPDARGAGRRWNAAGSAGELRTRRPCAPDRAATQPARRSIQNCRIAGQCPPGGPCLGRYGHCVPAACRHGGMRARPQDERLAAQRPCPLWRFRSVGQYHQDHDHARQQGAGVPCGGVGGGGADAGGRRGCCGRSEAVLCGGYEGNAETRDCGKRGGKIWRSTGSVGRAMRSHNEGASVGF